MVLRLVLGILAVTLIPLGVVFVVIGLVADDIDRGTPEGMLYTGLPILAAGLVLALGFVLLWRREAARRQRRSLRSTAEVVSVRLKPGVRSGGRIAMDLSVRLPGGEPASGRFFVIPGLQPAVGSRIEIAYDPADPANFEPVTPV